jgi:hypothetical protein
MALLVGQPIDARELEQVTSQWPPERFASMCNDLVWAVSGRRFTKLPSFTERVNAADGGIDAEWEIEVTDSDGALPTPIVGPGWNVFQYKKRDLIAQDRKRIISNIKSSLKGSLANLPRQGQKPPDRYILFLNVDLKHDQTLAVKNAILEGYAHTYEVHVEVIGAAEIAAVLNSQPHLRAAYFSPLAFKTWEEANRSHRMQKLFGFDIALVGRQEELGRLRALVDDPQVRVVVVAGPHDIGKSRLVLEATRHRPHGVVFALDPRSMKLDDYRKLVADQRDVVCVIEDPDPDGIERLVNELLVIERLTVIVTLPDSGQAPVVSYGTDKRIQSLSVGSLSDEDSRNLLSATGKRLDFSIESWILDRAKGNPGILLAAASIGEKLRDERGDFEAAVGSEFAKRIESELGADGLKCAELLSPLTHVGISGRFEKELKLICEIFGEDKWEPRTVLAVLEDLEKAGLVRRGGSFAEITAPLLANYLVTKLLRGLRDGIFALFARLHEPARIRFIRRLSQIKIEEVEQFWDALFDPNDPNAPFGNFKSVLRQEHTLRFVAGAVPERTIRVLESGLIGTSREERLAISDEVRRELMWALEQLLFRAKTSGRALRLIWLLAEAENETWDNNATGVLSECFHPLHSQMPLSLDERLAALREFTLPQVSKEGKLVAIRAASKALERGAHALRHSAGVEPLDKRPVFTYAELFKYARDLVDLVLSLGEREQPEVAEAALGELPRLVFELGLQGQAKEALERFEKLVDWAKTEKPGLDIFSLSENIEALRQNLERHLKESELSNDRKVDFQMCLAEADRVKGTLEKGSFSIRLKRWAAGWSREDDEHIMVDGRDVYRSEVEFANLAKETVSNPALLSDELVSWLLSSHAQNSGKYFFFLGNQDFQGSLRPKMEGIGSQASGANAFAAYWGGWAKNDRPQAKKRLVELVKSNAVTGEAFVWAAGYLGPSESIVELLKEKAAKDLIAPRLVSGILYGGWLDNLSEKQILDLLKSLVGRQFGHAALVIEVIERWLHTDHHLNEELKELAWQCLEANPSVTSHEEYSCQHLAARLAESDVERGFRLLEKLLTQPKDKKTWNPIDRYGAQQNQFWNILHKVNPERAIRTVLSSALANPVQRFRVTWDFKGVTDQEKNARLLIKLAMENEKLAEVIAGIITTARPGFWPIAFEIVEKYPGNERIQTTLTGGLEQQGDFYVGPYSQHLESFHNEVERVLQDPETPPKVRLWLRDVLGRMEGEIAQHVIWEYDEDANDLRRYIEREDKNSPERIWAIARVLKHADWKDVKRMLTVEDIEDALPQIDLPEKKRKALEKALEVWRSGS